MEYDPSAAMVETLSMAVGLVLSLIVTVPMIGAPAAAIPEIVDPAAAGALSLLLQPSDQKNQHNKIIQQYLI